MRPAIRGPGVFFGPPMRYHPRFAAPRIDSCPRLASGGLAGFWAIGPNRHRREDSDRLACFTSKRQGVEAIPSTDDQVLLAVEQPGGRPIAQGCHQLLVPQDLAVRRVERD